MGGTAFRVAADRSGDGHASFGLRVGGVQELVSQRVPVLPATVVHREQAIGAFSHAATSGTSVWLPDARDATRTEVQLQLSPAPDAFVADAVKPLLATPPNRRLSYMWLTPAASALLFPRPDAELRAAVQEVVRALEELQEKTGRLAQADDWYFERELFWAVLIAREAGVQVRDATIEKARASMLATLPHQTHDRLALQLLVLARTGGVDAREVRRAFALGNELSDMGRSIAALTVLDTGGVDAPQALEMLRARLDRLIRRPPQTVPLDGYESAGLAYGLAALARYAPDASLLGPGAETLLRTRESGRDQGTLYGLGQLTRVQRATTGEVIVRVNGQVQERLSPADPEVTIRLADRHLKSGENEIAFEREGEGLFFWRLGSSVAIPAEANPKREAAEVTLVQRLKNFTRKGQWQYPQSSSAGATLGLGDTVQVELTIRVQPHRPGDEASSTDPRGVHVLEGGEPEIRCARGDWVGPERDHGALQVQPEPGADDVRISARRRVAGALHRTSRDRGPRPSRCSSRGWFIVQPGGRMIAYVLAALVAAAPNPEPQLEHVFTWGTVERPPGSPAPFRHQSQVVGVAFSRDGRRLVSAALREQVALWDVPSGDRIRLLPDLDAYPPFVALSPDGRSVVFDRQWTVVDVNTGKKRRTLGKDPWSHAERGAFAPDGKRLFLLQSSGFRGGVVRAFDVEKGIQVAAWGGDEAPYFWFGLAKGGRWLVAENSEGIELWDVRTGKRLRRFDADGAFGSLNPPAVASRSTYLFGGADGKLSLWDVATGRQVASVALDGGIERALISDDGKWGVTVDGRERVVLWTLPKLERVAELGILRRAATSGAISGNGRYAAFGTEEGAVEVFDLRERKRLQVASNDPVLALDVSADGLQVLVGDLAGRLRLAARKSGELRTVHDYGRPIAAAAISPDASKLAVSVRWSTDPQEESAFAEELRDLANGKVHAIESRAVGMHIWFRFSRDGARFIGGDIGGGFEVWSADDASLLAQVAPGSGYRLMPVYASSSDLRRGYVGFPLSNEIKLRGIEIPELGRVYWNLDQMNPPIRWAERSYALRHELDGVTALELNPEGGVLAVAGRQGDLRLLEAASGKTLKVMRAPQPVPIGLLDEGSEDDGATSGPRVYVDLAFLSSGELLAVADDGALEVFGRDQEGPIARVSATRTAGGATCVATIPGERLIIVGTDLGQVIGYRLKAP